MSVDPVATFRQEAAELVESLEQTLLDLTEAPDDAELVDSAFRAMHTLKGSGSMFGFDDVATFLHDFETAFDRIRKGEAATSAQVLSVSLRAKDHVANLIEGSGDPDGLGAALIADLNAALGVGAAGTAGASADPMAEPEAQVPADGAVADPTHDGMEDEPTAEGEAAGDADEALLTTTGSARLGVMLRYRLPAKALGFGTDPLLLLEELAELGPIRVETSAAAVPRLEDLDPTTCYLSFIVEIAGDVADDMIDDVFLFIRDEMELEILPLELGEPDDGPTDGAAGVDELGHEERDAARREGEGAAAEPPSEAEVEAAGDGEDERKDKDKGGGGEQPAHEGGEPHDGGRVAQGGTAADAGRPSEDGMAPDAHATKREGEPASANKLPAAERTARRSEPATAQGAKHGAASMRVSADRLNQLMDQVGELVIANARLAEVAGASHDQTLLNVAEEVGRLSAGLRDTAMGIRMVSVGTLFSRFRRLVHDLSAELGKELRFVASGEETELDKTMLDQLADPLVHLIRNAVDHGLEDTPTRRERGKDAVGTVTLSAAYEGAEVVITVADDGAGLDAQRIRTKAIASGIIAHDADLDASAIHRLIFEPGFSTAKAVTSVSGRGVGMDVVRRSIEGLRGAIEIATEPSEGTAIKIRLPSTLAIIDGMLVRVGGARYAIPLAAVEECVELPDAARSTGARNSLITIRDELVPFLTLRAMFGSSEPAGEFQKIVVVSSGDVRAGLVVDQIIGSSQTVIKRLSPIHEDVKFFSGATILGDGEVALILNVMQLAAQGQQLAKASEAGALELAA